MPRAIASSEARAHNRREVLSLLSGDPSLGNSEIARRLNINESTVRSIRSRWSVNDLLQGTIAEAPKEGRPWRYGERWKRCAQCKVIAVFLVQLLYRHLARISQAHPFWSLRRLGAEMYQYELKMLLSLPRRNDLPRPRVPSKWTVRKALHEMGIHSHRCPFCIPPG